ncbi:TolC family protein [Klebsiella pneumoniae]|uniref:Transporter n=1 Tax=Shewanella bicestrii TaxID=2018305 RepID=A0A220UTF5_9GAMM|nr:MULTISPECIES: TolC family protein [Gammaproteobacteria]ASK71474.1 transporter [Shewanella bicestrii]QKX84516.1 TolC family protein [Citrobacter freundii]
MRMKKSVPMGAMLLCFASSVAFAQTAPLNLAQALEKTLKQSPVLQEYPYQLRLNEAQRLQAGLKPNPDIGVELENVAGTGSSKGLDNAELTLTLSQLIEMGDKRTYRLEKTQWQQALLQQKFEVSRLDALAATTRSYIRQVELQQLHKLIEKRIVREQRLLDIAKQRAAASSLSDADVTRLELRLTRSQLELSSANNAIELGRAQLAAHWASQPDFGPVQGALATLPLLPSIAELQTSLLQSPTLTQFVTQTRLHETELQLAKAEQKADLRVSAGVRRIESLNDNALVLGVSMPWQLHDPSAGQRLAAQTQIELSSLQQQQLQTSLQLLVRQIYLELEQLRQYSKVLQSTLLPQTHKLQQLSEQGYQQGQVDLFSLLAAEQELRQAEVDLLSAQSRFHLQLLELERLTGHALTVSGPVRLSSVEN